MNDDVRLGERWRLWSQFALRGPGFPAAGVLRLAPEGLAGDADKFPAGTVLSGPDWDAFAAEFADTARETSAELQRIAAQPAFRAAVAWQNRPVLDSGIDPFIAWTPEAGRTSRHRDREGLVAHYWERFCVKNDSIGFFGPVGWGSWDPAARGVEVDPGTGLISAAHLYFSSWAVDTLAKTLDADGALREWTAPRRVPFVRIAGDTVVVPGRPPQPLSPDARRVLEACDGVRPARDLARELGDGTMAELTELARRRWIVWKLEVPADAHPERYLRTWLNRIEDPAARERGLAGLDLLERGRERIRAVGEGDTADADGLSEAMSALERDFTELTDTAGTRAKGARTAPCRALVFQDCVRATRARLGPDVLGTVAPLDLLLTSATWMTSALGQRVMERVRPVFERLRAAGPVDLAALWFACMPILHGDAVTDAEAIQHEFQRRWREILDVPADASRIRRRGADISAAVEAAFAAPRTGWGTARYLSPDLLFAGDTAAVARDDFDVVLGELHLAANTISFSVFVNQHPAPAELLAETGRDFPQPRLFPLLAKEHKARLSARIRQSLVREQDYYVGLVDHTVDPGRPRTVLGADVAVEDRDGDLEVVLPDGARFELVEVFAHVLTTLAMDLFRLLPEGDHAPRVTIDRMVVARETWRRPATDLAFATDKDEARRFVRARHWREELELPRFVFVVSPTEPRPFYVDFDSPVYVNILAKAVRRLARQDPQARLTITEMLPTPDQTWLTDDEGRAYTAELRLVAVDQAP
ncbi:lantibiotic dehydratase [Amycolatopsis sp. NPDC049252]|uniref:lantibiotic dehydratase n=1 Tax=Amycolatopsis sp. NPDC049252 TaxID=3363933 RepID=UPI0037213E96